MLKTEGIRETEHLLFMASGQVVPAAPIAPTRDVELLNATTFGVGPGNMLFQ